MHSEAKMGSYQSVFIERQRRTHKLCVIDYTRDVSRGSARLCFVYYAGETSLWCNTSIVRAEIQFSHDDGFEYCTRTERMIAAGCERRLEAIGDIFEYVRCET